MSNGSNPNSLQLSYNQPLNVAQNFSAVCAATTETNSILQIQNLSTTTELSFFIEGGGFQTQTGTLPPNDPQGLFTSAIITNGSQLVVSNISALPATALVTLRSAQP